MANMIFLSIYKHSILFRSVSVSKLKVNNEQSLKEQRFIFYNMAYQLSKRRIHMIQF